MGAGNSAFKGHELDDYQDLTYLTKKEIINVFDRFSALAPTDHERESIKKDKKNTYLSNDDMEKLVELQVNPFRTRILQGEEAEGLVLFNPKPNNTVGAMLRQEEY